VSPQNEILFAIWDADGLRRLFRGSQFLDDEGCDRGHAVFAGRYFICFDRNRGDRDHLGAPQMKLEMNNIKERLAQVQEAIEKAAIKSGRSLTDITLVAVTKGVESQAILEVREAGLLIFGENRVQEAESKIPVVNQTDIQWHMIGHLQTNKIKAALSLFNLIQSVDSVRLAKEISEISAADNRVTPMLLEVNISGEPKKFGFSADEIYTAIDQIVKLPTIKVLGLMAIGPNHVEDEVKRQAFKKLKSIFSVCKSIKSNNLEMKHLSMGMSDDFEIAIEEGSNMIRLGRAIFR